MGANTAFSACGGGAKWGPEASCGNFGAILRMSLKLGLQRSGTVSWVLSNSLDSHHPLSPVMINLDDHHPRKKERNGSKLSGTGSWVTWLIESSTPA